MALAAKIRGHGGGRPMPPAPHRLKEQATHPNRGSTPGGASEPMQSRSVPAYGKARSCRNPRELLVLVKGWLGTEPPERAQHISAALRQAAFLSRQRKRRTENRGAGSEGAQEIDSQDELLRLLVPASQEVMQEMSWPQLSSMLWALAVLHHKPGQAWLEAAMEQGSKQLGFKDVGAATLAVALWGLARLGCRPRKRWLKRCRQALEPQWRSSPARPICLALWSLARMGDHPPETWLQATLLHLLLHMVLYPTPAVWRKQKAAEGAEEQQQQQRPAGASGLDRMYMYRHVELNEVAARCEAAADHILSELKAAGRQDMLVQQWFLELRYRSLFHLQYGGMTGQQYSMTLYGLAILQYRPSDKWMGAFYSGAGSLLARQALLDMMRMQLYQASSGVSPTGRQVQRRSRAQRQQPQRGLWSRGSQRGARSRGPRRVERPQFEDPQEERFHFQKVMLLLQAGHRSWKLKKGRGGPTGEQGAPSDGRSLQILSVRDLAPMLWSMARVQHEPPTWWMRLYEAVVLTRLAQCSVQEMVTILYGYGALRRRPPRILLRCLLQLLRTRWKHLGLRGTVNMLVALARLRLPPHAGWVRGLLTQAFFPVASVKSRGKASSEPSRQGSAESLTFEGAARCLWALGTLCIDPGPAVMEELLTELSAAQGRLVREAKEAQSGGAESVVGVGLEDRAGDLDGDQQEDRVWQTRLLQQAQSACLALGYVFPMAEWMAVMVAC